MYKIIKAINLEYRRYLELDFEDKLRYNSTIKEEENYCGLCWIASQVLIKGIITDEECKEFKRYLRLNAPSHTDYWYNNKTKLSKYDKRNYRKNPKYGVYYWKPDKPLGRIRWLNKHMNLHKNGQLG